MIRLVVITCMLLVIATSIIGCRGAQQPTTQEVTFEQLLSDPKQYDGKYVALEGFYFDGFEVRVIAETLEYSGYAEGHLVPRGRYVWVGGEGIPWELWNQLHRQTMMGPEERYGKVRLEGKFEYGGKYGHGGGYSSQIIPSKVELLEWSPPTTTPIPSLSGGILVSFDVVGEIYRVFITNRDTIEEVFAVQRGESQARIPSGRLVKGQVWYNEPWSWHIDPEDIHMAEVTMELCDGLPSHVEEDLDYWVNEVKRFCPWHAKIVRVEDFR